MTKMNQNADPEELAKFAVHAAQWWDENSDMKMLHQVNPIRLSYIESITPLNGKSVIDIGCGGGILAESMAKKGAIVTGIDLNKAGIDVAKLHQLESGTNVTYETISAEGMAEREPHSFDVVTCMEMLEHVPDPAAIVKACAKLAKAGGNIIFSTLNRNPKSYLFAILGAEYILKLLPKNTHDYAKFIKPSELSDWVRENGLTPAGMRGIHYNPISKQFSLTDDVSVNYLLHARSN